VSHVVALCGGVGGAKLAFGLARVLPPEDLTIVVNTGDDFEHLGLHVSPDVDTVLYTLSGLSDRERGWGRAGETWGFMAALRQLGGDAWFNLGDHDLAMHVERSWRLRAGQTLSQITAHTARTLGIAPSLVPMTDDPVRTVVETPDGPLDFQRYFVQARAEPRALRIRFDGAEAARPSPGFAQALARGDVACVIICPSNPYLSIDPILSLPGVREALGRLGAPIVAVSPIVGGQALKGPAAKLMAELGAEPGSLAVARHYRGLVSGLVIDDADAHEAGALRAAGVTPLVTGTIMLSDEDRTRLARETLDFARGLAAPPRAVAVEGGP
jgi:LPPG:FO 2-phospho-L-lactate transferase